MRPPSVARERKPALAALALLLIAAGVLASVYLQMQAGNRVGVIQVTQAVPQGQQISASDITEVMVAQDKSINYVTWDQRGLLNQYTTSTDLVPGTLLIGQMLTNTPTANGTVTTIAVSLKDTQYPPTLAVGDTVNAYFVGQAQNGGSTPASGSSAGSGGAAVGGDLTTLLSGGVKILQTPATTSSIGGGSSSDGVFTVSVPKSDVSALLSASAEGDLVFTSGAGS